jgi:Predicted phosphoribosyltransferases
MSDLPEEFDCTITDWEYIYGLCRSVSEQVKAARFDPEMIVALARGGWFGGRCICDFLGLNDLTSLKMEHYVGTAQKAEEPQIRYPMPEGSLTGKDVLIIDDIADTGGSIQRANEYVTGRDPGEVRTATLQLLESSQFEPDFTGERLEAWTWVVYPWNFIEDMADLIEGVMRRADDDAFDTEAIRRYLASVHEIDRIEMEIAQPNRLDEVLTEMERRHTIEPTSGDAWRLAE